MHSRWGTPHISIVTLGVLASFLLVAIQLGDTMRAAYHHAIETGYRFYSYGDASLLYRKD